jgi:NAD(P)H-hydrate epimerase
MKIFSADKVKIADSYTIKYEPISSINLMERAANAAFEKILEIYPESVNYSVFAGPGNNGGDGLVIARHLFLAQKNINVFILNISKNFSSDFNINLKRLSDINFNNIFYIENEIDFPEISENDIIIDSVFGSGLSRNIDGLAKTAIEKINNLKNQIIAIDIPSGLFGEKNSHIEQTIIKANHTLTFEFPFLSFFFPENIDFVGNFHVIPIGIHRKFINETETNFYYIEKEDIKLKTREKFSHKGTYGHSLIIAGSYGKAGASVLSLRAAHRIGAGLVTGFVPKCNYKIVQISSPETMLIIDDSKKFLSKMPDIEIFNSIAIGPGVGFSELTVQMLEELIKSSKIPLVIDADAITIISQNKDFLNYIPENSIFTPHPKEFERLVGKSENNFERLKLQQDFAKKYKCFVILKGANTMTVTPEGKCYINSTGNAGMATAGSGDVLTGIICGLLAQKYSPEEACIYGVFLHGQAGDFAKFHKCENALIASDIIENLPSAFQIFEVSKTENK